MLGTGVDAARPDGLPGGRGRPAAGMGSYGFSPPDQDVTYVEGERGDIVAVLFGYPLEVAATGAGIGEKILWVGRVVDDAPADLVVRAAARPR
ncbi:MAG: hypothetical protein U0R65_07875 [Candidatus Nanopelagicales bacterium]